MKLIFRKVFTLLLAVIIGMTTVDLNAWAMADVNLESLPDKASVSNGDGVFKNDGYNIFFSLTGQWDGGYNANIRIQNTGDTVIENWYLEFEYHNLIAEIWNAEIVSYDEGKYIIKNAGWNQDIAAGGYIEFGFSGNEDFKGFPEKYELSGTINAVTEENYSIEYIVDSDWGSGFTGTIKITNNTDSLLEDWILEFDFDRDITGMWEGAVESHEGNHYIVKNAEYNSNIAAGQTLTIGFTGKGGTSEDRPGNFVLYSYDLENNNIVTLIVGADDVSGIPELQIIAKGEHAIRPQNPVREGFLFIGWYADPSFSDLFDFEETAIYKDTTLYARWLDYLCEVDSDSDGIVDSLEEYIGTDIHNPDTDEDGLTDYQELYDVGTHPLLPDSNQNGIDDFHDDLDGDGIINADEIRYHTNPGHDDTDVDGISDYDEIFVYLTDPTLRDTDNDGASDGWEIRNGYDPLIPDTSFSLTAVCGTMNEATPVIAKVNLEAYDADVESLHISRVHSYDNPFITPFVAGYLGDAYDFTLDGKFDSAELIFEYDESLGQLSDGFQPRIYYFNEETQEFEELENQIVENGRVTVVTTHFSTYILLNKVAFDKVWDQEIKYAADGENLNVVFVVDLSASMKGTKLTNTQTAINSFIDVLDAKDQAALVSFTTSATVRCKMTNKKATLKNAVNSMSTSGDTAIYNGIGKALDIFEDTSSKGYNMMIVFTDGYDEPTVDYEAYYTPLTERANSDNVIIYTIGISTIDEELLTRVAESTGGKYYYASVISQLQGKVDEIKGEAADLTTDSNNDGISDYHTRLIKEGKLLISNASDELKGIDLNFDEDGNLTDDCDCDGLKNGEEIEIVTVKGKTYIRMKSHPLRVHSDGDGVDDYTEVQRGSDPLKCSFRKDCVDILNMDELYYFENIANDLRNDDFWKGLMNASAIANGVWNRQEIYRDLMIDYYCEYTSQETIETVVFNEEKKLWCDTFFTFLGNAQTGSDMVYEINNLISYANGATKIDTFKGDFAYKVRSLIVELDKYSEYTTRMYFELGGLPYAERYLSEEAARQIEDTAPQALDYCSDGIQILVSSVEIMDTIENLARIEANNQVFNENIDALLEIAISSRDKQVSAAADSILRLLGDEYTIEYANIMGRTYEDLAGNFAASWFAKQFGYSLVILAVRDLAMVLSGSREDLSQMYRILCYSELVDCYGKMVDHAVNSADGVWYHCFVEDQEASVIRNLENIAQLRILGECEYYNYIRYDGLLSYVGLQFTNMEEIKGYLNISIGVILDVSDILRLKLSPSLGKL